MIRRHYLDGWSQGSLAEEHQTSVKAIKSKLARLRKRLRESLEDADKVCEVTLREVRKKRRRRDVGRKTLLAGVSACVLCGGFWFLSSPAPKVPDPMAITDPVGRIEGTIAVMRVDGNGHVILEEVQAGRLSSSPLSFDLTQYVFEDLTDLDGRSAAEGSGDSIIYQLPTSSRW